MRFIGSAVQSALGLRVSERAQAASDARAKECELLRQLNDSGTQSQSQRSADVFSHVRRRARLPHLHRDWDGARPHPIRRRAGVEPGVLTGAKPGFGRR